MKHQLLFEIAAFTPNAALNAAWAGADRIELCSGYAEGGLTPSAGTVKLVASQSGVPVHVLIRPRAGDFIYGKAELDAMKLDIEFCKKTGCRGVVIGILTKTAGIDLGKTRELVDYAFPMSVTFHRAFDLCHDQHQALEDLISCGVHRVLTSGGQSNVSQGMGMLAKLVEQAGDRIIIMAGGGVKPENIAALQTTGVSEIHLSAKVLVHSPIEHNNLHVNLTSAGKVSDKAWYEFDGEIFRKIKSSLNNL